MFIRMGTFARFCGHFRTLSLFLRSHMIMKWLFFASLHVATECPCQMSVFCEIISIQKENTKATSEASPATQGRVLQCRLLFSQCSPFLPPLASNCCDSQSLLGMSHTFNMAKTNQENSSSQLIQVKILS